MILDKTTDTSGLTQVVDLSDELQPVFDKAAEKYASCDIELYFVFQLAFPMNMGANQTSDM